MATLTSGPMKTETPLIGTPRSFAFDHQTSISYLMASAETLKHVVRVIDFYAKHPTPMGYGQLWFAQGERTLLLGFPYKMPPPETAPAPVLVV